VHVSLRKKSGGAVDGFVDVSESAIVIEQFCTKLGCVPLIVKWVLVPRQVLIGEDCFPNSDTVALGIRANGHKALLIKWKSP
jgi:hypothetical protein